MAFSSEIQPTYLRKKVMPWMSRTSNYYFELVFV